MPNYVLQYDLNTVHIRNRVPPVERSAVYRHLGQQLSLRGWTKYQKSCWRGIGKTGFQAQTDANAAANNLEANFGVGVIRRLDYQRYSNFFQVRP